MALFLLIDPVDERRAVLKALLGSQHRLVEHRSLQPSLTGCQNQSFDAAFVAWPDGVRNHHDKSSPSWSCERFVLMLGNKSGATEGSAWAKEFWGGDPITISWPVSASDIAELLNGFGGGPSITLPELVGSSAVMRRLLDLAKKAAGNDRPVLICGEPGTGKQALARWMHARSWRHQGPFETFHCTGLDPTTAFGELFGHEKGAFSWATQPRRGLLASADRGTLYFHELCELDKSLQLKLLRLLERPAFGVERLGGQEPCPVDVRIVAGTRLPARQIAGREICEELFYRLAQNQLEIPPLRSRTEDIPELVQCIVKRSFGSSLKPPKFDQRALAALRHYPWPENLNELEAVVREAIAAADQGGNTGNIGFEHLPPHVRNAAQHSIHPEPSAPSPPAGTEQPNPEGDAALVVSGPTTPEGVAGNDEPPPFPNEVECDGYRTIREIRTTNFTRVFLAELKFNGDLVILKLLRPQNQEQSDAMRKAIALHKNRPEAQKVMIPIHHANTWSQFYLLVVACLDNSAPGQEINRNLYRPFTFQHWLKRKGRRNRGEAIDHLLTMLQVLDFFHHNELVFNDVKPDNFGFYRGDLVAIDYGGISFIGQPPHEWNRAYGPKDKVDEHGHVVRDGLPAEDVFAVVQIMAQALYDAELQLLAPEHVEALAAHYSEEYKEPFDKRAWKIIVKGLAPIPPNIRFQDARSLTKELEELSELLPKGER